MKREKTRKTSKKKIKFCKEIQGKGHKAGIRIKGKGLRKGSKFKGLKMI